MRQGFAICLTVLWLLSTGLLLTTASAQSTETPAAPQVWVGQLVSNQLGATTGTGSIVIVRVEGQVDVPIELQSGDTILTGTSGSKPELGPYAAEFAPVPAGTWTITLPTLNTSTTVETDNYNLADIQFIQVDAPQPTPTAEILTAGPPTWSASLQSESIGPGTPYARLLVQVEGRTAQPIRLSSMVEEITTSRTGNKENELGPDIAEFAGLTPARYIIEPLGLNTMFEVELKENVETLVIFREQVVIITPTPALTPTQTPAPTVAPVPPPVISPTPTIRVVSMGGATDTPTLTATPTITPTPLPTIEELPTIGNPDPPTPTATATFVPIPTLAPTLPPSPTPVTRWLGSIQSREQATQSGSATIVVQIIGIEGLSVQLRSDGGLPDERRCITGQGGVGQDTCAFIGLMPGPYVVTPEGLGVSLPVQAADREVVRVVFDVEVLPPGVVGWDAQISENTNGAQALQKTDSTIRVRVEGRAGQLVALRSVRGTERMCEVVYNPVLGSLICEFNRLGPGVYAVEALHTGAVQRIFVDGQGQAEIVFAPSATYAELPLRQPVVGSGAQPLGLPTATQPAVAQSNTVPVATLAPSPTLSPTVTATAVATFTWQGEIVESVVGISSAIVVRAVGLPGHPVQLRRGLWESDILLTGSKPEYGVAAEFGGLGASRYTVELVDLAEFEVDLAPNQFVIVEFRYDFSRE